MELQTNHSVRQREGEASSDGRYDELGLRTVINASGTLTRLGGSRMAPEVLAAMAEAAASFVQIDDCRRGPARSSPRSPAPRPATS